MRKIATVLLALVLGLSLATAVRAYDPPAPAPGSGINGTVHDLGTAHNGMSYVAIPVDMGSSSTPLNRICIFCHAPHNTYRLSPANLGAPGSALSASQRMPQRFKRAVVVLHIASVGPLPICQPLARNSG